MADATEIERLVPYESASELRAANSRLLDAYDHALEKDSSADGDTAALRAIERDIKDFLKRGVATGAYIEETKERTGCQVLLDYWVSSLSRIGAALSGVRLARFDGDQLPDLKDKPCPYVGLEAFRDKKFFFGRDADTEALLAQVRDSPLVIVFGASGSGKSSLVMGGVLPALAASDNPPPLRIVPTFVPGNAVLRNLAEVVTQACAADRTGVDNATRQLRADAGHLWLMVGGASAPPTVIVIDQFEEVFTLSEIADRDALVANLAALLDSPQGHRVILTMREEFRSRMVELEGFRKFIDRAWYPMRPMGYEELKAAVEQPAAMVNLQYQSGIVDDLVKKVLGQPAALPLLQFTLRSLWDKRDRNRITWEVYNKVGDPLSALKTSADQFYDRLAPQTQTEVRRVLLELVRVDDLLEAYRQPVPRSRLMQAGRANTDEVLQLLAKNDYIRITSGDSDTESVVEVKHESLIRNWPRFVAWIDEKRYERRQRLALTEAVSRWAQSGRPQEGLLTGWQLQESRHLPDLSDLEREFVEASSEAVEQLDREKENTLRREAEQAKALAEAQRQRADEQAAARMRQWRLIWGLMVVAGLALGAAVFGRYQAELAKGLAEDNSKKAEELRILAEKQRQWAEMEAMRQRLTAEEQTALAKELAEQRGLAVDNEKRAVKESRVARSSEVAVKSNSALAVDPELSLLLAMEAARIGETQQSLNALRQALPESQIRKILRADGELHAVAYSPDGKWVAGASEDQTVHIWNAQSGDTIVRKLTGHKKAVHLLVFSPNGRHIATESMDGTGKVWDIDSGKEVFTLEGLTGRYPALAFSSDGARIAAESGDYDAKGFDMGRASVWDVKSGEKLFEVSHPAPPKEARATSHAIRMVVFSPDGKLLVTASNDGTARVWDASNGEPITTLRGHKKEAVAAVVAAAFSPHGSRLVTASLDGTVRIYETGKWDEQSTITMSHRDAVYDVRLSPKSERIINDRAARIVTVSADRTARIWDLQGKPLHELTRHNGPVTSAVFSPDGQFVATVSSMDQDARYADRNDRVRGDNTIRLWNVGSGQEVAHLRGAVGVVTNSAFSPDGRYVVTGHAKESMARIWATRTQSGVDLGTSRESGAPRFSPVEKILAKSTGAPADASLGRDAGLFVTAMPMAMKSGQHLKLPKSEQQTFEETLRRKASMDRLKIDIKVKDNGDNTVDISWTVSEGVVRVWNHDQLLGTLLPRKGSEIRKAALSPNGRLVVIVYKDKVATLWDYARNRTEDLSGHSGEIYSADFNRSGNLVVTASADGTARVWDTTSGKLVEELKGHTGKIYSADFNRSGNLVVTASADKTARVWDTASGKQLDELKAHTDEVNRAVFSPKGDMIATTGDDNTARIWTWPKGKTLILRGHNGPVYDVTFSADGRFLLTASRDRSARIWDTATGESVETFSNRVQPRFDWDSVSFGPEGKIIMIHPPEGGIKLFPCELCGSLNELRALAKTRVTRALTPDERERYLPASGAR